MPYREIHDDGDEVWIVFSTHPRSGANVRPRYADGWLSFQRGTDRRRLAPIPPGWDEAPDDQLRTWLRGSELVARMDEDDESEPVLAPRSVAAGVPPAEEPRSVAPDAREAPDKRLVPSPAAPAAPTGPAARVQKSIERIRAMLSDIRSHDG